MRHVGDKHCNIIAGEKGYGYTGYTGNEDEGLNNLHLSDLSLSLFSL